MPPATFQVNGAAVRSIRMDAGIEISELAEEIGITSSYLSRIEVGRTATGRMKPATYVRLRTALGATDDQLLATREEPAHKEE